MEFMLTVGSRRSVRWFRPWQPVERAKIQRILEAARLTSSPANLQPWRAVVVEAASLRPDERELLLAANNWQTAQGLAPVWIYWFADPAAARPSAFVERAAEMLPTGALAPQVGWSVQAVARAIEDGVPPPRGLPPLEAGVHGMPPEVSAILAAQETNGLCQVAQLAAVSEGLGTCLHAVASSQRVEEVKGALGVPERFLAVWLQLVGHPVEGPEAGGQRPREDFAELYALGRWQNPFPRDPEVVSSLRGEGLLQPPAPLPGRFEELEHLSRMFGISEAAGATGAG